MTVPKKSKPKETKRDHSRRFLSVAAVALELDVCQRSVRRWMNAGLLPYHQLGRQHRIAEDDLRSFLALRRRVL